MAAVPLLSPNAYSQTDDWKWKMKSFENFETNHSWYEINALMKWPGIKCSVIFNVTCVPKSSQSTPMAYHQNRECWQTEWALKYITLHLMFDVFYFCDILYRYRHLNCWKKWRQHKQIILKQWQSQLCEEHMSEHKLCTFPIEWAIIIPKLCYANGSCPTCYLLQLPLDTPF